MIKGYSLRMPPRNTNCLGVYLRPPPSVVQEADNRPYGKAQGKDAGGVGAVIMGSAKANAPILIWRGFKNPEALFCFQEASGRGQTKKRGEANQLRPSVISSP